MLTANNHPLHPCLKLLNLFLFLCCCIFTAWPALSLSAATITHLPGFSHGSSLPFHLETGYIEVDELNGVELFYYFIESERSPGEDPLLLWLTGGPGCSALSSIALEIGPFKFKSKRYNGSLPNLEYNPYSWTKISSIIFLDSPVGAGFSFSRHPQGYETGDKSWAKHAEIFLTKWLSDHKQFQSNSLYIAGDSYAGKVVPVVVHNLLNNEHMFGEPPKFNIQGYIIGNPMTGEDVDYNALVPFTLGMGIISAELFEAINRDCRDEPSYSNPKNASCAAQLQIFNSFINELMVAHILEPVCGFAATKHKFPIGARPVLHETAAILSEIPALDVNCRIYAYYLMYLWANNNETREALHVKEGTVNVWLRCNYAYSYSQDIRSSIPYHLKLTKRGYPALVYSGDHDMIVPFVGTREWIRSLNFSTVNEWRSWHVDGQVAGYTESYSHNLTFATVKNAGHTAAEYKPKECLAMFQRWISRRLL